MKLIADSGATKAAWAFVENNEVSGRSQTPGISPYYMDGADILHLLRNHALPFSNEVGEIYFYGSGCDSEDNKTKVEKALKTYFPSASQIEIASDMLAAARSLCQREKGIACIIGTGSNSCYFDGTSIKKNIRGYGYILGDAGSGAVLGRRLLSDFLYGRMPQNIKSLLVSTFRLSDEKILKEVYQGKVPSRFLASFARFVSDNGAEPYFEELTRKHFSEFVETMLLPYPAVRSLPVHFTGSVAFGFRELLRGLLAEKGLRAGQFLKEPMEGLLRFHMT
ncbi:MAG TPA: hypothetical protein ENJ95_05305 [Bacteroidetes bacterium]|nr:hypothetical protein [Bacteroidota bacterium]